MRKVRGIYVTVTAMKDALKDRMDKQPTQEELADFIDYVANDIREWLRDNARAFDQDRNPVS